MSDHRPIPSLDDDRISLDELGPRTTVVAAVVGLIALGAAAVLGPSSGGWTRFGQAYLVGYAFWLSLSLGALFFVAVQHVTRASWSVVCRRIAEHMAVNLLWLAVMAVPLLLLASRIFPWASGATHAPEELLHRKAPFLNLPFFYARWAVYFTIWCGYALWFRRQSMTQDRTGDPQLTVSMEKRSGLALLLYALSVNLASYDLLMSMDPAWYSTMFGPYFFAGGVVGFFSILTIVTFWLQGRQRLAHVIHVEHLHDYGKLLFAFVFFWAYLAFSQYMLIWYANIPEETTWFLRRQENGWHVVGLTLVFGHWLLPFAGLMSRFSKRRKGLLLFWAMWVFAMHYVDLYWVVMPEVQPNGPAPSPVDLLCFLGLGGLWFAGLARFASAGSLVPTRDPRLSDSLAFENA